MRPGLLRLPLVEGFQSLALMYPVVIWLARWLAVTSGRDRLTMEDISQALAIADHHHGYSPALGTRTAQGRVRQLSRLDDIRKLCLWFVEGKGQGARSKPPGRETQRDA